MRETTNTLNWVNWIGLPGKVDEYTRLGQVLTNKWWEYVLYQEG